MSLAGARESSSAGDAGAGHRGSARARGGRAEACSLSLCSQRGKKYPPASPGDLTDLRRGRVGVVGQDAGVCSLCQSRPWPPARLPPRRHCRAARRARSLWWMAPSIARQQRPGAAVVSLYSRRDTRGRAQGSHTCAVSSRGSTARVLRPRAVTTSVSPGRTEASTGSPPGRCLREPVMVSDKIVPHPAWCSASRCASRCGLTLLPRADPRRGDTVVAAEASRASIVHTMHT